MKLTRTRKHDAAEQAADQTPAVTTIVTAGGQAGGSDSIGGSGSLLPGRHSVTADPSEVRRTAAEHGLAMVDLRSVTPSAEATALVPEAVARELAAVPLAIVDGTLEIAVSAPDPAVEARLRAETGRPVRLLVAGGEDVQRAIGNSYRALVGVDSEVSAFEARDSLRREAARLEGVSVNDEAPVVRVVQLVITQALRDRASDVHIEPSDDRVRVRYRIDGALHDVLSLPGSIGPAVASRLKIMAGLNIVERRRPQDGQITLRVEDRDVDIRVSTTAVVGGEKVVLRLLDKSRPLYELSGLGMPDDVAERFRRLLRSPYGMVMCAGPTGSGKTTTLYASLGELNSPERNIMTIEDPVEYTFPTVNQIQIHEQAGVTFASGLRGILRQDPDVILVGEVRDVETARIAVQSALTGHFVLSSLHATDSISALFRLLDMGIEPFLVSSSVTAVVAQRLVRRTCTHCRAAYQPGPEELAYLDTFGGTPPADGFTKGEGCNFCSHTGFLDRIGVYELLALTDELRAAVLNGASHDELRKLARLQGMDTLQEQSVRLVESGVTTLAEVMRSIYVVGV
jgi:type IV pilus assembly protein PilB